MSYPKYSPCSKRRLLHLGLAITTCAFSLGDPARGQTSHAAMPSADTAPPEAEEAIRLSEFDVKPESVHGYTASETTSGPRVATKIADLPFQVNVITSEFFKDFAIFDLNDNIGPYISNFSGLDQGGGFTLRGFTSTYQLRDGFFRLGRYGTSSIDRIEVIKGPNAAVYGQSSPNGIINIISKMPRSNPSQTVEYTFGSYDTQRERVELTGSLGWRTSYILELANYDRTFDQPFYAQHNKEAYLAVKHQFKDDSTLLLQAEFFLQIRHGFTSPALPILLDTTVTPNRTRGYDLSYAKINQNGAQDNETNRGIHSYTATYEKRFNDVFSARAATNVYQANNWTLGVPLPSGDPEKIVSKAGFPNQTTITRGAQLGIGKIVENGGGFQGDALVHYWMFHHRVENKELATVDINDYWRWDPSYKMNTTSPDAIAWSKTPNPKNVLQGAPQPNAVIVSGQPINYYTAPFNYNFASESRNDDNRDLIYGGMIRHQSAFMDNRLLTFAGIRRDYIILTLRDIFNHNQTRLVTKAWTPNTGLNYKITKNIAVYGSYSQAFNPASQKATASNPIPNETGWGYDYGIKSSFFGDRLNFTIGGFYTVRKNVTVTIDDPNNAGQTLQAPEGTQLFRGVELDGTWNVTNHTAMLFSYGHNNAIVTNAGANHFLQVGRSPASVVPNQASIAVREDFWGPLKGLSANLSAKYRSRTPTQIGDAGITYSAKPPFTVVSDTGQENLKVPMWVAFDAGIRYTFITPGRLKLQHTIALNVNNVLDRHYLNTQVNSNGVDFAEHRSYYVTYTLQH